MISFAFSIKNSILARKSELKKLIERLRALLATAESKEYDFDVAFRSTLAVELDELHGLVASTTLSRPRLEHTRLAYTNKCDEWQRHIDERVNAIDGERRRRRAEQEAAEMRRVQQLKRQQANEAAYSHLVARVQTRADETRQALAKLAEHVQRKHDTASAQLTQSGGATSAVDTLVASLRQHASEMQSAIGAQASESSAASSATLQEMSKLKQTSANSGATLLSDTLLAQLTTLVDEAMRRVDSALGALQSKASAFDELVARFLQTRQAALAKEKQEHEQEQEAKAKAEREATAARQILAQQQQQEQKAAAAAAAAATAAKAAAAAAAAQAAENDPEQNDKLGLNSLTLEAFERRRVALKEAHAETEAAFAQPAAMKMYKFDLQKAINFPLNSLLDDKSNEDNVRNFNDKIKTLVRLLSKEDTRIVFFFFFLLLVFNAAFFNAYVFVFSKVVKRALLRQRSR